MGGNLDSPPLTETALVVNDSRGLYYVTSFAARHEIHVYDSRGRVVRTIGKQGAGPGEFMYIKDIVVLPGDSLQVFDQMNSRYTVLDPAYRVVRSVRFPMTSYMRNTAIVFPDRSFALNGSWASAKAAGYPLHLFDRAGTMIRSFGSDGAFRADLQIQMYRRTAASSSGGIWSVPWSRLLLEEWSRDGTRKRALVRSPSWFQPWMTQTPMDANTPSQPIVIDVEEDGRGRLIVITQIPDRRQSEALVSRQTAGERHTEVTNPDLAYDTMLEVIDPAAGKLLFSRRLDQYFVRIYGDSTLVSFGLSPQGVPFLDVWRIEVVAPKSGG